MFGPLKFYCTYPVNMTEIITSIVQSALDVSNTDIAKYSLISKNVVKTDFPFLFTAQLQLLRESVTLLCDTCISSLR